MLTLTYFYSHDDEAQNEFRSKLEIHCSSYDLLLVDICVDDDPELMNQYAQKTPVINIGPYVLKSPIKDVDLVVATKTAIERHNRLSESKSQEHETRVKNAVSFNRLDRFSFFFSKTYALMIAFVLILFVGIPFLAPVLEKNGNSAPAQVIYKIYRVFCHQLAFRSFFLYGEQLFYPRELAGIDEAVTYEAATQKNVSDLDFARSFLGNEELGFKVALCERDVAIYSSLALFGILFHFTGKKIKKLHWIAWIIIAMLPIALDGVSQIPSLSNGWPAWMPVRESTPFLRVLTGFLFGAGTGWYMFPLMEENLKETRVLLTRKLAIIKKIDNQKMLASHENQNP